MTVSEEIKNMLDGRISMREMRFIGRTCIGKIDSSLRGKIELAKRPMESGFTRIQISVLDRVEGMVDQMTFLIGDVTGLKQDKSHDKMVYPLLSTFEIESWWNCEMTEDDYQSIAEAINGYLELFQSEKQCYGQEIKAFLEKHM